MGQSRIEYGDRTFAHIDILSGNCVLGNDLIGESLSIDTLEFDVRSDDTTLTTFTRNAPLKYYFSNQLVGQFYVTKVERVGRYRYRFTTTSLIGLLDESRHYGGIYSGETSGSIISNILSGITYTIDTKLTGVKMYGWLPVDSRRNNLCQVLFALGASIRKNSNGTMNITVLSNTVASTITEDRVFDGGSVSRLSPATRVDVTEHQYIPGAESVTLYSGKVESGEIITFEEPMHSLAASGATIIESGANYAKMSAGTVTLTGKKYTHTTKLVSMVSEAPGAAENVFSVEEATLVSLPNSFNVAERVLKYYETVEEISSEIVLAGERPGDMVKTVHPFGGETTGGLKDLDITLGSFLRANATVRVGFEASSPSGNLYENMAVISEGCTWTVPEGCSRIRVVLIGDGKSGTSGSRGNNGGAAGSGYAGQGGAGGSGGTGGRGGKILELEKKVAGGQSFNIGISVSGGESTFDTHSSADGNELPAGYTEITTGTVYGAAGRDGYQGADGRAGTASGSSVTGSIRTPNGSTYYSSNPIGQVGAPGSGGRAYLETSYIPGAGGVGGTISLDCSATLGLSGSYGGNGANGSTFGNGGNGGNGGSGGHGAGGYTTQLGKGSSVTFGGAGTFTISSATFRTANGGNGGSGGSGGTGAKGCVIIYY